MKISAEQLRILEDSAVAYDRWIQAERDLVNVGPVLAWKSIAGKEYLYERRGGAWGASQGLRSVETEALFEERNLSRDTMESVRDKSGQRLEECAVQYRALRLPRVHPIFGAVCREADRRGLLGANLMVVGTNAMPAYEIEAQRRFPSEMTATADCDLAWMRTAHLGVIGSNPTPLYSMLKAVDPMFAVNTEKRFQARNAEGYEVEVLLGLSVADSYPKADPLRPLPLPEQDWLLYGRQVAHVVFDLEHKPVRLVVPDPRWMALHKMWLADQEKRNPLKRAKDRQQGEMLAGMVTEAMIGFPVDDDFRAAVPAELQPYLAKFLQGVRPSGIAPLW